jgi:hypothetical protein
VEELGLSWPTHAVHPLEEDVDDGLGAAGGVGS